ncbi:hypothetical protein ABPG74_007504 [Tetrahymena malaccensis]
MAVIAVIYKPKIATNANKDEQRDQNNNIISAKRLFVANQDVQSFIVKQNNLMLHVQQEKSNYTVSNFQLKQKTYRRIVNLLPLENIMMLVGCSKDGQLIAWDISNVFQDQYLYSVQLSQDSCIELIQFNVTNPSDIIAVFSKTIFLIDVISLNIKYQCNILFLKLRDLSQNTLGIPSSFEICLFTADQQFTLMGQNFIPYQKIKGIPLQTVQDIQFINKDPNDPQYFLIGKNNKTISTYPFSLYTVKRNSQQIILISEYTYASQFIQPTKYYDSYNNIIYDLKVLSNKGSMSTLTSNSYDPTRNRILLEQQQNIFGKTGIKFNVGLNKKILFGFLSHSGIW